MLAEFEETDRFTEIEKLKAGWLDGEGEPVSAAVLKEARKIRDTLRAANVECCVFPTVEGGISIEDCEDDDEHMFSITLDADLSVLLITEDENGDDVDEFYEKSEDFMKKSASFRRMIS